MADYISFDSSGNPQHVDDEGVTQGIRSIPFHWVNRETGKSVFPSSMYALGRRNLEFRRSEAEKAGYNFVECAGKDCPHH